MSITAFPIITVPLNDLEGEDIGSANSSARSIYSKGGLTTGIKTVNSTYVLTANDHTILCDASVAGFNISLPPAAEHFGREYVFIKIDNQPNDVSIVPNGAELINGVNAPVLLSEQLDGLVIQSNGIEWWKSSSGAGGAPGAVIPPSIVTVTGDTGDYLATINDDTILCNATTAPFAINLPLAIDAIGLTLTIKKIDISANAVIINPNGAETVDGASVLTLVNQWDVVVIQSDGVSWFVHHPNLISAYGKTLVDDLSAAAARNTLGLGNLAPLNAGAGFVINGSNLDSDLSITAYGRTLIDDVDAATARNTLGATAGVFPVSAGGTGAASLTGLVKGNGVGAFTAAVAGTDYQVADSELAAIAALASAADKLPYFTGPGAASLADITAYGRTLIDDINAAAARTTLELGALATLGVGAGLEIVGSNLALTAGTGLDALPDAQVIGGVTTASIVIRPGKGVAETLTITAWDTDGDVAGTSKLVLTSGNTTSGTLNGVVIGGTTPLAGTFTTLTASTSVSTPILIGPSNYTSIGASGSWLFPFLGEATTPNASGKGLAFYSVVSSDANVVSFYFNGNPMTATSGTSVNIKTYRSFAPTSGSAQYWDLHIAPTINQTGGASGATRGITIQPILTAAADWRGLEIHGAGTAINQVDPAAINKFAGDVRISATITAGGTTGAQTINKTAGRVNFAAAATSLVVTNSLVTVNSIIIATVVTNDATLKSVIAVPAAGSFTLHANAAATAETRVNFLVLNLV